MTVVFRSLIMLFGALSLSSTHAQTTTAATPLIKQPACQRAPGTQLHLHGITADYLQAVTRQWLLTAPDANPAMLEMFRDRDRQPLRSLEPWAGEFAGKYLLSAVQVFRVTHDA